jgi:hypothetical protein
VSWVSLTLAAIPGHSLDLLRSSQASGWASGRVPSLNIKIQNSCRHPTVGESSAPNLLWPSRESASRSGPFVSPPRQPPLSTSTSTSASSKHHVLAALILVGAPISFHAPHRYPFPLHSVSFQSRTSISISGPVPIGDR